MAMTYDFPCGCKIPVVDETIKQVDGLPSLNIDYYNLNHKCPATWELYAKGKTKGVFQLEKSLGQAWSKRIQPVSIEEIAALISLIRPGTLKSIVDGKSMTQHYVDRKNGEEDFQHFHHNAKIHLDSTYGVMVYQEQTLAIAKEFGGFNLSQAETLRKAIGKKKPELMEKSRKEFIEGCKTTGIINNDDANALFDIIEKSNRYSFNKCLDPLTVVETETGLKTLDELSVGEKVKAPLNDINDHFVEVIDKIDTGQQELFEIITESGKVLNCTLNHKLLCEDGGVRPLYEIIEQNLRIMCQD